MDSAGFALIERESAGTNLIGIGSAAMWASKPVGPSYLLEFLDTGLFVGADETERLKLGLIHDENSPPIVIPIIIIPNICSYLNRFF